MRQPTKVRFPVDVQKRHNERLPPQSAFWLPKISQNVTSPSDILFWGIPGKCVNEGRSYTAHMTYRVFIPYHTERPELCTASNGSVGDLENLSKARL